MKILKWLFKKEEIPNVENFDWIKGSQFEEKYLELFDSINHLEWRKFLLDYCIKYHGIYYFDILDEAFRYLEFEQNNLNSKVLFKEELSKIKEDVNCAMYEYSLSLNEIATAVNRLLIEEPISKDCIRRIINHVWEAYSCNEEKHIFLNREDKILCSMIDEI